MNTKYQIKNYLSKALTALAMAIATVGALDAAAAAAPIKDSLKLAQVGIRSRINAPTPLNIRPRTHTPLSNSNYSRPSSRNYRTYDRGYGYYGGHHDNCNSRHHHHTYHDLYKRRRYNTYQKRRSNRGKIIIFNAPGNLSGYGNRNGYVRIISK